MFVAFETQPGLISNCPQKLKICLWVDLVVFQTFHFVLAVVEYVYFAFVMVFFWYIYSTYCGTVVSVGNTVRGYIPLMWMH